ncbi:MAG TPA: sigma-70 family RNA polymerase sigma factor [Candidatus Sumerlaeota bacterium]|nr:sigma-70 family RNA polymerase sigma factor [Candidatus Sumerlaeota bacterium]HMZ52243.1 sigma-70 family RNA polymerase sigma factor [Candidatus Sumerlaeota bacterium]HNM45785.1 sigma-70 family RNA polymerase sigma factor [Candidatus Sumerlaeota bacterium]
MSEYPGQLPPDQEKTLIQRARSGDAGAMDALLSAHQDRVFRTALGLLGGDQEAALETAQEVLVSVFRHLDQFRGDSRFSTWLYRMTVNFAKNRSIAEGRRAARFVSIDNFASDEEEARPREFALERPSPRAQAAGGEMMAIMMSRIDELPEEFRAVLVLRYMEDRSYEEISDALGVPLGTIKSRINRGRSELRKLMADVMPGKEGTP